VEDFSAGWCPEDNVSPQILGLFVGTRTRRRPACPGHGPDQIPPLPEEPEKVATTREELLEDRKTVLHEVGHYPVSGSTELAELAE
jgi:hypothetical protein